LIVAIVLVEYKIGPVLAVIDPPVMFKVPSPVDASPEKLW
jgi:hypothetical protein